MISMRRRMTGFAFWGFCVLAFLFIAAPSISIIESIIRQAAPVLSWSLLTSSKGNGLANAILGSLILLLGVLIVAGIIGVAAGTYLAEYATGRPRRLLRFFSEILAGMPSIVIGYIGYVSLVVGLHWQFSLAAGIIALSVLVLPYIVKTTEVSLMQVPTALREAASGLGMPRWQTLRRILIPTALPGISSGIIVALAISTGELAPLLFTAGPTLNGSASFALTHTNHGIGLPYLTDVVFFNQTQGETAQSPHIAAAAGLVLLVILIILIVLGRIVSQRARRQTARMAL
ncbi:MAG TPA: ABC transporter permease subunit [Acidimicrobiales bacterium]|jgi:phosphate transport system permease protein|nr:ABC transporter permease subunit [Acidimicrobiales bacterium]